MEGRFFKSKDYPVRMCGIFSSHHVITILYLDHGLNYKMYYTTNDYIYLFFWLHKHEYHKDGELNQTYGHSPKQTL